MDGVARVLGGDDGPLHRAWHRAWLGAHEHALGTAPAARLGGDAVAIRGEVREPRMRVAGLCYVIDNIGQFARRRITPEDHVMVGVGDRVPGQIDPAVRALGRRVRRRRMGRALPEDVAAAGQREDSQQGDDSGRRAGGGIQRHWHGSRSPVVELMVRDG